MIFGGFNCYCIVSLVIGEDFMKRRNRLANVRIVILTCFLILQGYLTDRILTRLWLATLNLFWYFCIVLYQDTVWYLMFVFLFIKIFEHSDDEWRLFKRNKDTVCGSFWQKGTKKFVLGLWGVLAVIVVIVNLKPTAHQYSGMRIEGETISKLEYKYRILSDWVSDNIVSEEFLSEEVSVRQKMYSVSSSHNRYSRGSRDIISEYIEFENENGSISCYPLSPAFFKYIYERKKESVPSFTITYYKKSGVIVAIDGYTLNDLKKQNDAR